MCSTSDCRRVRDAGFRSGFTLVEVLVALTIGGILATVVFQLMQGSTRFVALQSAREEVQQNGRASLDLIAGDLRALPPSGIQDMRANSIRFHLPRAWGVLCNAVSPSTSVAWVLFPAGGLPSDFQSGAAHWGIALEQVTDPGVGNGRYVYVARPQQLAGGSQCVGLQPNATNTTRYLTVGFSVAGSMVDGALGVGAVIRPGTQVMIYEETAYDIRRSTSGGPPGIWIRRMSGYSGASRNMQPMAGPLPADTSVVFSYLQADGVSTAATAAQVRQVRVWMEMQSRGQRLVKGRLRPEQVDTLATYVVLRNR